MYLQEKTSPMTSMAQSPLYTPGPNLPSNMDTNKMMMTSSTSALNLTSNVTPPKTSLSDLLSHMTQSMAAAEDLDGTNMKHGVSLKFVLKGLLHGVAAPPFIVKMCPPLTTRNWATYQPLLAVGMYRACHNLMKSISTVFFSFIHNHSTLTLNLCVPQL